MGIQAIKGVEIGDGFETARRRGSVAHDEMYPGPGGVIRSTNRAGGLEGGMTNGQAAAGPRGDEADLDGAARAGHRRHGHRRRGGGDPSALRRLRGARRRRRRRVDGGPGARPRRAGEVRRRLARRDQDQHRVATWQAIAARDHDARASGCHGAQGGARRVARARASRPSGAGWPRRSTSPFLDTDAAIEAKTGRTIADLFATDGEQEFRRIEEEVVRAALAETRRGARARRRRRHH